MGLATVKVGAPRFVDEFSRAIYPTAWKTTFAGVPVIKNPLDLWVYQEIIFETRPKTIIETGTWKGGSALYLAAITRALRLDTLVITIDNVDRGIQDSIPPEDAVICLVGDSVTVALPLFRLPLLVILDSSHEYQHVLAEMERFAPMVSVGSYLIVEDTNICGNPIEVYDQGDPMRAVREFLKTHREFEIDRGREKYMATQNPSGYLRKVSERSE